jgi:hypothetical protein
MFGIDFYPTPPDVIETMMQGIDVTGLKILEPSAGSGNIVDWLKGAGAEVMACEIDMQLRRILSGKCELLEIDCMDLRSHHVSHINMVVMNPPFSKQEDHLLHLWEIAPAGCDFIMLCNASMVNNKWGKAREQITSLIDQFGSFQSLGKAFKTADRNTEVEIGLLRIKKPGENNDDEFDGFFMEDEREEETGEGIMSYNVVRDLVNRYVEAVRIYDKQIEVGVQMNKMISSFFGSGFGFQVKQGDEITTRNSFKKSLQLAGWKYIFEKLNMEKIATKSLKEDINKFVQNQYNVPFSMRNIYHMIDIVVGTTSSRIDKAINEVFDKVTSLSEGGSFDWKLKKDIPKTYPNRETWKTNSHYLLTKKFIVPSVSGYGYSYNGRLSFAYHSSGGNCEMINDLEKCLCYITGEDWDDIKLFTWNNYSNKQGNSKAGYECLPNTWYDDHHFFKYKMFKKGTMHIEFKDEDTWARFNQRVAKIKGYPLFEGRTQTDYQKKQTGRKTGTVKTTPVHEWVNKGKGVPVTDVLPDYGDEDFTLFE